MLVYDVVRWVSAATGGSTAAAMSLISVAAYGGEDVDRVGFAVLAAAAQGWLAVHRRTHLINLTTDGAHALEDWRGNPHLPEMHERAWIAARRLGAHGREDREPRNVAIPTGGSMRGGPRDPEAAALAAMWRLVHAMIDEPAPEGKRCPSCRRQLPLERFGLRTSGGPRAYCRRCEAAKQSERQHRRKEEE